jgi:hypothetical protein
MMKKVLVIALAAVLLLLACSLAEAAVDPFRGILASFVLASKIITNPVDWVIKATTTDWDPVEDAYDTADKLITGASNAMARTLPTEEGYTGGGGGPNAACQ